MTLRRLNHTADLAGTELLVTGARLSRTLPPAAFFALLLALLAAAFAPPRLQAQEINQVYLWKTSLVSPNPILAIDLVNTPVPELVVTDVQGRLKIYDSHTGKELRGINIGGGALTAPIVGDFAGTGFLDLAIGTAEGEVIVLNGRDPEVIGRAAIGASFSIQPTIVTLPNETGGTYDRLVLVDEKGVIHGIDLVGRTQPKAIWTFETNERLPSPIVVGRVRDRESLDLVATTTFGNVIIVDPNTGNGEKVLIQEKTALPVSPLLADINGDSRDEVIVTLGNGEIRCYRWDAAAKPRLQLVWNTPIPSGPVSPPILLTKDGDISSYRILQLSEASIQVLDAVTGHIEAQNISDYNGISTQSALIPRDGRYPEVGFGLKRTIQITTNMNEWIESGGTRPLETFEGKLRHDLSHGVVSVYTEANQPVLLIGMSPQEGGHLYAYDSGLFLSETDWPTATPWMTLGGSPYHNPRLDLDWASFEKARRIEMRSTEKKWKDEIDAAMAESDWKRASEIAADLASFNPYNEEYSSLRISILRKKYFIQIIVAILVILLAGSFSIYKLTQSLAFRRLRRRAESAAERGEYEEAARYYQRLLARRPRNVRTAFALAHVYIIQRDYSAETLDVYKRAHEAFPADAEILNAFARALLLEPKTDARALDIYKRAMPTFPEPSLLEYGIGRCALVAREYEEAGKRLRSALRGGVATDALYQALCEVYLKTNNFTVKALPVFQQQFPNRRGDKEFLQAYLLASIDAKKMDQQVESLCQAVLEIAPDYLPAYIHLARVMMQKKQIGAAVDEVRHALRIEPANREAIALLAQCLLIQNRRDDEAVDAYLKALSQDGNNADLLRTLAAIFFDRNQFNELAVNVYHRSLEQNPADLTTLRALAQAASLTADHDLSIRIIEKLTELGHTSSRLTTQLANAYIHSAIFERKTIPVFREALRVQPENQNFMTALARAFVLEDRADNDAIPVYESHLANNPQDLTTGRQLAKSYINTNRYEQALKVTTSFLVSSPGDEEIQRLNALASLYDNKIDVAVSEYQRILERNPSDREALVNLALAYGQKLRADDEAMDYYQRALAVQPGNDMLHLAQARVYGMRNEAVNSVSCYKKALDSSDGNEQKVIAHVISLLSERPELLRIRWFLVELLVSYGHLRESLEQIEFIAKNHPGQAANALKALDTILKKDPKNVTALVLRGTMLLTSGQTNDAAKSLEKAVELLPASAEIQEHLINAYNQKLEKKDDPETRFRLGKIYYSQQEFDAAIGCFQKTAQDYRWEAESTKMLGRCFTGKGMLDLALQEYKKLVVDVETKELLYDLAQRYEVKKDLVGAKTVYRQLFAADIDYKDVKTRFEMLSGSTSDPMAFEKTAIVQQMSEEAARRYELLDELGRGAMGIVYRARDRELEEIVALKILPDNMSNNPEAVRRFKIEARNARKLSHPNIVRIHDIGEEMGRKYISMEYVDGTDLKRRLKTTKDRRLPHELIIRYAMQIVDALGYAHRLGIVHRDIKPANIMLTSTDEVKITDFGIAKMMDSSGEGTMIGAVIGTPLYMSPEQVQGIPVDNRADIYSFGIMIYELFNGQPPFVEGDLAYQHIHREPNPIESLPPALWEIVSKCLAKKKEDRWTQAEMVYEALREYASRASNA